MNSGVYQIKNNANNNIYIGSSINFNQRKYKHFSNLRNNKHKNIHLQNSYNKYGEDSLNFSILAICPKEYLIKMEQWFIDNLNPEYNIRKNAKNNLGLKHSEETKEKMRQSRSGRIISEETKRKISNAHKGKKLSEEHKEKLRISLKGRKFTDSHKEKIRQSNSNKIKSDETKLKISISNSGKKRTKEVKDKIRQLQQKSVIQLTKNNEFMKQWDSGTIAGKALGITSSNIHSSCRYNAGIVKNNQKTAGGFIWKFKNRENIENK